MGCPFYRGKIRLTGDVQVVEKGQKSPENLLQLVKSTGNVTYAKVQGL